VQARSSWLHRCHSCQPSAAFSNTVLPLKSGPSPPWATAWSHLWRILVVVCKHDGESMRAICVSLYQLLYHGLALSRKLQLGSVATSSTSPVPVSTADVVQIFGCTVRRWQWHDNVCALDVQQCCRLGRHRVRPANNAALPIG
jgi:hypothetical protein